MGSRHTGRKLAMQLLYQAESQNVKDITDIINDYLVMGNYQEETKSWAQTLARGVWESKKENDSIIKQYLKGWDINRINRIDLSLLRLAFFEMIELKTPQTIVINESLELAKKYSTDDSSKFINGILGTYVKNQCSPDLSKD